MTATLSIPTSLLDCDQPDALPARFAGSDANLQDIWVVGEISNLSAPASGHLYFTLKDSGAALRCVMWRNAVLRQPLLPQDGEAIEVHGSLSVYEAGGNYQLYADLIRRRGGRPVPGILRLKARLEEEGGCLPTSANVPSPAGLKRLGSSLRQREQH